MWPAFSPDGLFSGRQLRPLMGGRWQFAAEHSLCRVRAPGLNGMAR